MPVTKPSHFFLNAVPVDLKWGPQWRAFEVEVADWNPDEDYDKIVSLRREFRSDDCLLESHGRLLVIIPLTPKSNVADLLPKLSQALSSEMQKPVRLEPKSLPETLQACDPDMVEVIRKGIGELLTLDLIKRGFHKIGSGGGIGSFIPPSNWFGAIFEKKLENVRFYQFLRLNLTPSVAENKFYLAVDVKGGFESTQKLSDWLASGEGSNIPPEDWKKGDKSWRIHEEDVTLRLFQHDIFEEIFIIKSIDSWDKGKTRSIGWGRNKSKTLGDLVKENQIPTKSSQEKIAVLKPRGRVIKNPNIEVCLPASYLYRSLSQPAVGDIDYTEEFKRFTKLRVEDRYGFIMKFFGELSSGKLTKPPSSLVGASISYARPSVREQVVTEYGKTPRLNEWGVQEWGPLRRVVIFHNPSPKIADLVERFRAELEKFAESVRTRSPGAPPHVKIEAKPMSLNRLDWKAIAQGLDANTCPVFVLGRGGADYGPIKTKLTQEQRIPVQVLLENTLFQSKSFATLARTVFPQILVKIGGFPYRLAPAILDRALIIGLDKARDSGGNAPSASAGVAAVTPEGRYVSGASTPLERNTTDFINVDLLAPDLLRELDEQKFASNYEYVVILRDGSPETCRREVDQWKTHLEKYNMKFIFLASRKTHAFRVFPQDIETQIKGGSRITYPLPLILNGDPLPASDFLVLAARAPQGTPKPVLYTVMANTVGLPLEEIKEKVLGQVTSLSMLCWESPSPTSQPLPLHYADKLAAFTQLVQQKWNSTNRLPMFI